ncbi:MAG TPA: amino acid adenylation domain-containing protein [Terriglobales bacterium]|nr:amino acid adenylation domain-containing protein [Terriglobales bacterium]
MESSKGSGSGHPTACNENPSNSCVPDLIRRRAKSTPAGLAIRSASSLLTYEELDCRSNQLANYLRTAGARPGQVVGVCLERSIEFPIAALAILKAGCAYLPLETRAPGRRLQTMLKSAQVSVVVTTSGLLESLAGDGRKLIAIDHSAAEIGRCSTGAIEIPLSPDQLAYVIYTSGSTGTPKAVAVGHGSLLNLIQWHNRAFGVTAADRATQLASIGFDAAVWELWPNLAAGASVHLVDDDTRTQPEKLRDWLVREKITISFAPTPLAEQMLKLSWPRETALRFLLTGADTLHNYPPANLPFALVNNYGPTECTVVATSTSIPPQGSAELRSDCLPPIGRAIDNAEIYILDSKMRQVPAGECGEIYIGGAGLAQGYLNDAALTAERFVKHPFRSGARLYRTGDMGCALPDGQIAFRGRVDEQVKINGYRIELNEVASVLRRHAALRESAVVASENSVGEKQLVAYVVPASSCPPVSELRDFLAKDLPDYMLPAAFVSLDALPVSSSGKVDRSALPAPTDENILREEIFLGPRTPTEQRVAAIVARLLGLERVGVNDNFFYLGGNSLFGTQVIARVRDAFDVEISLLKLFDHPTVADLAAEIERRIVARLDAMSEEEAQRLLALNTEQASA